MVSRPVPSTRARPRPLPLSTASFRRASQVIRAIGNTRNVVVTRPLDRRLAARVVSKTEVVPLLAVIVAAECEIRAC